MYGPPGTGKTMLAKAVANATTANFIQVVASEFVQKWLGDGPRMVRDIFSKARENAPCIIFIDEVGVRSGRYVQIDAVALKRNDHGSGDREVQRILMELLTQMDGFDQTTNVKVIMATNRPEMLDPALMRRDGWTARWSSRCGPPAEATGVPGVHGENEPERGGGLGVVREPSAEDQLCGHRVDLPGGGAAGDPAQPLRHPDEGPGEGVQEGGEAGGLRVRLLQLL